MPLIWSIDGVHRPELDDYSHEEKFAEFEEYSRGVPRIVPRITPWKSGEPGGFSMDLYLKHREYNALIGAVAMIAGLIVKMKFFLR